jgi:hypothetical protein
MISVSHDEESDAGPTHRRVLRHLTDADGAAGAGKY